MKTFPAQAPGRAGAVLALQGLGLRVDENPELGYLV